MAGEPWRGPSTDDGQESDEFLCGVAAECINDALLILDSVEIAVKQDLEDVLAALIDRSNAVDNRSPPPPTFTPESGSNSESRLSPAAHELIQTYLTRAVSEAVRDAPDRCAPVKRAPPVYPSHSQSVRQRAVVLLMEALSILEAEGDHEVAASVHIAIDRVRSSTAARDYPM